jgi:hypothetical protein
LVLIRAWCGADWAPELRRWLETAPPGEVAVWIEANTREAPLMEREGRPR